MKNFLLSVFSFLFIGLMGCGWLNSQPQTAVFPSTPFVETGKILDEARLKQGGKLLIIPFRPGSGVEASDGLDKIALMVDKAISDVLIEKDAGFDVLTADNADQANFILEGHITVMDQPTRLDRWTFRGNNYALSVKGRIMDRDTEKPILVFTDSLRGETKEQDLRQLGLRIGQNIGNFIVASQGFK